MLSSMAGTSTKPRVEPAAEAWQLCMDLFGADRPRMLDIQAEYGLKPPQFFALQALDEPVPMSSVANVLRCDRSAVTWITDRLEERGYVERRSDERDRRVKLLALTDEGRRVREEIRARLSTPPEALTGLSRAEQRTLRDLLRKALDRA
jgi:MarR family transcriptional regulator, organic hydroperoxide resistance regulator